MGYFTRSRKIVCENSYGYKLEFGYSFPYFLNSYSGIHDYSGNVATIKSAFGVGVSYVGTSVNSREIDLVIAIKDDKSIQIRKNQIYNIFPLKNIGTLYYYEGEIIRKINYYVEKVTSTRQNGLWYYTVNLICPSPYFMDKDETNVTLNNWDKLFEFPLEIDESGIEFGSKNDNTVIEIVNNSHIPYGMTITFTANGNVVNPTLTNIKNKDILKINHSLTNGERIVITTYNNAKTITYIDSNNNETDITNSLVFGTKFLQAGNGVNKFVPSADSGVGNLDCTIVYYNYYEAI